MQPTEQTVSGIGAQASVKAMGEIRIGMNMGKNAYFPDSIFYVIPEDVMPIAIIIGRTLISKRCKSVLLSFTDKEVVLLENEHGTVEVPYSNSATINPYEINQKMPVVAGLTTDNQKNYLLKKYQLTINEEHSTAEETQKVIQMFMRHQDVLVSEEKPLGRFNGFKARLITKPGRTAFVQQYRIAEKYMIPVQKELDKMLENGVIKTCQQNKSWNTPLGVVTKPDGSLRIVMNYKITLNPILSEEDGFSIPHIESETVLIGQKNRYFASLDVRSGYFQIDLDERDQVKTSFWFNNQNYVFQRWPFGLRPAGNVFCRAIAFALRKVKRREFFKVYVDDILIHAPDFQNFIETFEEVLSALEEHGIMLAGKKAKILVEPIKWLGRLIDRDGVRADSDHVMGIRNMKAPNNFKSLQSLLGALNWVRAHAAVKYGEKIAPNTFSKLCKPLTMILRQPKFKWTSEAEKAFQNIKARLESQEVIHFADFQKPFVLCTDASIDGVGHVLMQEHDSKWRLIRVGSKTLNPAQSRWSTIERECFAIINAINDCEFFLRGRNFVVKCDHKPLTFLDRKTYRNAKVERWANYLSEFNFVLQYIEGQDNAIADMFSRQNREKIKYDTNGEEIAGKFKKLGVFDIYIPSWANMDGKINRLADYSNYDNGVALALTKGSDTQLTKYEKIQHAQNVDCATAKIIDALTDNYPCKWDENDEEQVALRKYEKQCQINEETGLLMIKNQIYVPRGLRPKILESYHNDRNHNGATRMKEEMSHLFWPMMNDDIKNICESCNCMHKKGPMGRPNKPQTGHVTQGSRPWDRIAIDFIELPISTDGFRYCLTIQCTFTRFLVAVPLRRNRAIDAAKALHDNWFTTYTTPTVLESDRGAHFQNNLMAEFSKMYGISQKLHVSWRPQSTGQLERAHRSLKSALFVVMHENRVQWPTVIRTVVHIMNTMKHSATKVSPFEAAFGFKPTLTEFDSTPGNRFSSVGEYIADNREVMKTLHDNMRLCQQVADKKLELQCNPKRKARDIEVSDEVLLYRPMSAVAKSTNMPWIGPYEVIAVNQYVVKIKDEDGKMDWVHRSHVCHRPKRKPELGLPPPFLPINPPLRKTAPKVITEPVRLNIIPDNSIPDEEVSDAETKSLQSQIEDLNNETLTQEEPIMNPDMPENHDEPTQWEIEPEPPRRSSRIRALQQSAQNAAEPIPMYQRFLDKVRRN